MPHLGNALMLGSVARNIATAGSHLDGCNAAEPNLEQWHSHMSISRPIPLTQVRVHREQQHLIKTGFK
jgi:hypothetical protein